MNAIVGDEEPSNPIARTKSAAQRAKEAPPSQKAGKSPEVCPSPAGGQLAGVSLSFGQFSELVGLIYEGALENPPWKSALLRLDELFDALFVTLILRPALPDKPSLVISSTPTDVGVYVGEYTQYEYFSLDPFANLPRDTVLTADEFLGEKAWVDSSFFRTVLGPNGGRYVLGADFRTADGVEGRFRITRTAASGRFSEADRCLCAALLPHIKGAVHIHSHLDRVESERTIYAGAVERMQIGTVILDEKGEIMKVSAAAQQLLDRKDGIAVVGGALHAHYALENRDLQCLLRKAGAPAVNCAPSTQVLSITRPSGRGRLGIVIRSIPLGPASEGKSRPSVAVFFRDPDSKTETPHEVIRQLFEFTPAEASLALLMANGLTLDEAAESLGVRKNTARAHLRSIFSKTGVTRQTTLVRVLLGSVLSLI